MVYICPRAKYSKFFNLIIGGTDDDLPPPDPTNMALPTLMMAGTIIGSIFRADLSKNKVDVETNNLRK